ncbi:hypothetical protein P154DRAFT_624161 [Amniculicola lignicola CBS 123094]|uniref:Uncharacterized protein n=1 Tax=Amniculicola lignicola CBS 123094 TaxID=1392246 RepID=A0A6A5VZM4_9PLEO|nr:hypothetical protein P154DRAFT_624161 [Amniculicola lignicola CBS 123094]
MSLRTLTLNSSAPSTTSTGQSVTEIETDIASLGVKSTPSNLLADMDNYPSIHWQDDPAQPSEGSERLSRLVSHSNTHTFSLQSLLQSSTSLLCNPDTEYTPLLHSWLKTQNMPDGKFAQYSSIAFATCLRESMASTDSSLTEESGESSEWDYYYEEGAEYEYDVEAGGRLGVLEEREKVVSVVFMAGLGVLLVGVVVFVCLVVRRGD